MSRAVLGHSLLFLLGLFGLVTSVSANETQAENTNPGTTAWQIKDPATNRQIEGYASLTSVNVGGSISFFVSTSDSSYTMDFYRIGWYGGTGGREVLGPIALSGMLQPTPSVDSYGTFDCNWTATYVLTVPTNWVSGVYLVKLTGSTSGSESYIQFVVREDSRNSVYLFQRSITTDEAFNDWPGSASGGRSLYTNPAAVKVSFNRPYAIAESYENTHVGAGFFPRWEINMVRWLEMNGYDVTYATNIDVHENPNLLLIHRAFLSVGHDEYWSWEMRQNVEAARDAGVGLSFFGANESYWQMRLEPSSINGVADRTMVAYKSLSDPTTNPCLITILWRENTCKPSEQAFIGVESSAYNVGGNGIVIADASNWALAGTGLLNGSTIPSDLGPDADGLVQADSPAGTVLIAHSPLSSTSLSDSSPYPAYPYSDMVTYTAATSGATVFAVGTTQWSWTLDDWGAPTQRPSNLSAGAQQITQNVLARLATDGAAPLPLSNLAAIAGNAQVALSWSGSIGATSYNVMRSTGNGGPYATLASTIGTSYTDTAVNSGTTYYYVVVALNSVGASSNSNQASAMPYQPPSVVSVAPNSGSGLGPQTFSYVYSDTSGYQNIYLVQTILNTTATWPGSCGTMYITASSSLYLMKDNGSGWLGPVTIGQAGTLQNSQCTLDAGASSASGSGTNLTVNLTFTFQPGFTGLKNNFMIANDVVNNVTSGLQNRGTWTPSSVTAPSAVSVTPNSGSGLGPQTFSYVYSDTLGYQNIYLVQTILNTTATWPGSCGTMYIIASSSLYLMKDDGSGWLGPVTIGQPGTLQNSQCTLDAGASSASGSGTNLTVNLTFTFQPGFTGLKNNFMIADDVANNLTSGFQNRGTWTPSPATAPSAVSVTPNSGSGSGPQTFSYVYSDTFGYQDIYLVQTILNTTATWPGSCGTMYITASSSLYLMKDDGSGWLGPVTIGQPGTLQNSQCTLDAGASSASGSGNNLTVNLALTFQPGFTGLKNNFMLANDVMNNVTSGFQNRGTWTAGSVTAPSAVSVTPNSGSGLGPQTFSYVYSDTAGYQNIYLVQTVLNTTATWPGSCGTMYITASSSLYLMKDDGSGWLGPVTIGQPGTLQNSQCTLDAGASSASGSGNNLTVNLALTFQPGFTGLKNNFMIADDVANNLTSGLQNRGSWIPAP